ncbi:MAG: hypothetical protein K2N74_01745, partial [Clostridiales bacterium]|nr:hypothetical protein [Clostridiales bacterium]
MLILTIIAMGGGIIAPNLAGKQNTGEAPENGSTITAEAASITYPTAASSHGLGQFPDGYTYYYTDKDLYVNYHNGSGTSDLTKITVDTVTANNHGTKQNPYVIANTTDWANFVTYVMSDTNVWGSGKFFALAGDLNFSTATFRALGYFSGTFYGLGHIISNITTNFSNVGVTANSATGTWGYGLFCRTYNATITDLVVKDFTYQNFTQGYKTHNERGSAVGGVVGYASGNDYVLNCHTNGTVKSTNTYTCHVPVGGIVGSTHNGQQYNASKATTTTSSYVYRCSSELSVSILCDNENHVVIPAGIVGENYDCRNTAYIYDCAANVKVTDATGSWGAYASVGLAITGRGAGVVIDGLVGRMEFTLPKSTTPTYSGAITGVFGGATKAAITIKN